MDASGGECDSCCSTGSSSPSSSSSPPPLPWKSAGPLCSCAPPYCLQSATCRRRVCEPQNRTYILEAGDRFVNITRREFIELLVVTKDDDSDVDGTEYAQLVCLLEQAAFALQEGAATKKPLALTGLKWKKGGGPYTERFLSSLMGRISIFLRPIVGAKSRVTDFKDRKCTRTRLQPSCDKSWLQRARNENWMAVRKALAWIALVCWERFVTTCWTCSMHAVSSLLELLVLLREAVNA
jgi:hypothetical protein